MEYEDLLVYIDKMTKEKHVCALHVIGWLIGDETYHETKTQIMNSLTRLINLKKEYSPAWIWSFFGGEFQDLIDKKVIEHATISFPPGGSVEFQPTADEVYINNSTGELEEIPVWLCPSRPYDNSQKREIAAKCEKGINAILQINKIPQVQPGRDEWFIDLSDVEKRKLRITHLLEKTEVALRKLLAARYESVDGWTGKKDYVPTAIRMDKYGQTIPSEEACDKCGKRKKKEEIMIGKIEKIAERNKAWGGRKLGDVEEFLNACTLSELIAIIRYRHNNTKVPPGEPKEFEDVFDNLWKKSNGGSGKFDTLFVQVKQIRDPRAHVDQSLPWDDIMVDWAKISHDEITKAVNDYLEKQKDA